MSGLDGTLDCWVSEALQIIPTGASERKLSLSTQVHLGKECEDHPNDISWMPSEFEKR